MNYDIKYKLLSNGKAIVDIYKNGEFAKIAHQDKNKSETPYYAIYVVGQLRSFCFDERNFTGLCLLVSELKKRNKIPIIFFNVNVEFSFKTSEWHYKNSPLLDNSKNLESIKENFNKFECTKDWFLNKIKNLECEYVYNFYTDEDFTNFFGMDFKNNVQNKLLNDYGNEIIESCKNTKLNLSSHFYQIVSHKICHKMKKKYEIENDIIFSSVVILRPDLIIKSMPYQVCTNSFYFKRDFVRIFPSYIHTALMNNISPILNSMNVVSCMNSEILKKTQLSERKIISRTEIRHRIEKIFLELNGFGDYIQEKFPIKVKTNFVNIKKEKN